MLLGDYSSKKKLPVKFGKSTVFIHNFPLQKGEIFFAGKIEKNPGHFQRTKIIKNSVTQAKKNYQ